MDCDGEICRLCVRNSAALSDVTIEDSKLRCKLEVVFNFPIPTEEDYPTRVCCECFLKISEFHNFSQSVRINQEQLKSKKKPDFVFDEVFVEQSLKQEPDPDQKDEVMSDQDEESCDAYDVKVEFDAQELESEDDDIRPKAASKGLSEEKIKKREKEDRLIDEYFPLKCEPCSQTFEGFLDYKRHTRKQHSKSVLFTCCEKDFSRRGDILNHIRVHVNSKHECDICGKKYNRFSCLQAHQQLHSTTEKPFRCDQCTRSFSKKAFLITHMQMHQGVQCQICMETVSRPKLLRKHIAEKHAGEELEQNDNGGGNTPSDEKLICATCGKQYSRLSRKAFTRHVKRHTGELVQERVQCHICSQWLSCKTYLKIHIDTRHNEEDTRVECDVCHQVYPNRKCLMTHKQRVHIEEKFHCELCDKKFKRRIGLIEHRASKHTGQTLYSCDVCGMVTNSNATLYAHRKKKHPEKWLQAISKNGGPVG